MGSGWEVLFIYLDKYLLTSLSGIPLAMYGGNGGRMKLKVENLQKVCKCYIMYSLQYSLQYLSLTNNYII